MTDRRWGKANSRLPCQRSDGRAALAWQAEACPTHAAQPPGYGQRTALGGARFSLPIRAKLGLFLGYILTGLGVAENQRPGVAQSRERARDVIVPRQAFFIGQGPQ